MQYLQAKSILLLSTIAIALSTIFQTTTTNATVVPDYGIDAPVVTQSNLTTAVPELLVSQSVLQAFENVALEDGGIKNDMAALSKTTYVRVYVREYVFVSSVCVSVYVRVNVRVYVGECVCACVCVCMSSCICACDYVCGCVRACVGACVRA